MTPCTQGHSNRSPSGRCRDCDKENKRKRRALGFTEAALLTEPGILELLCNSFEVDDNGCWIWIRSQNITPYGAGYGRLTYRSKEYKAHRLAYFYWKGPIPLGLVPDHLCRQTACINPDHLEAVTQRENTLRGIGPTAQNATKTSCLYRHPLTPENTYVHHGHRSCKRCNQLTSARRWKARAEAAKE